MIGIAVENLVTTYFGSPWIFGIALLAFFIIVCLSIGIPFESSVVLSVPIVMAIASSGFLAGKGWIGDAVLVVVGIIYGLIVLRLLNR